MHSLRRMIRTPEEIIELASSKFSQFEEAFHEACEISSEVIFFGSYVHGYENERSDIDVLFVGEGKRKSNRYLDFIWVSSRRVKSRVWLCSELANHIANYGVWYKGKGLWREKVFFNESAITKKKSIIYQRLTELYLKRFKIHDEMKIDMLEKVLLNSYRLKFLANHIPNPPTCTTVYRLSEDRREFLDSLFDDRFLGKVGEVYLKEIFFNYPLDLVFDEVIARLSSRYLYKNMDR